MKKLLCGFAFLLFSIAMFLAELAGLYIPIIAFTGFEYIGLLSAVAGLVLVLLGALQKPE